MNGPPNFETIDQRSERMLLNYATLRKEIVTMTEYDTYQLFKYEMAHKNRLSFTLLLHQRYMSKRTTREQHDIKAGSFGAPEYEP